MGEGSLYLSPSGHSGMPINRQRRKIGSLVAMSSAKWRLMNRVCPHRVISSRLVHLKKDIEGRQYSISAQLTFRDLILLGNDRLSGSPPSWGVIFGEFVIAIRSRPGFVCFPRLMHSVGSTIGRRADRRSRSMFLILSILIG